MDSSSAAGGFAAMGSEARLAVLQALVRAGDRALSVGDILDRTGQAPSTLSHHLKMLAAADLIVQERKGRSVLTRANLDHLAALGDYILQECCADVARKAANDG